jgi:hypothetical protein
MSNMVECKSCKHKVDSTAKTCPSCGVANPRVKTWTGCLVFFFLIAAIGIFVDLTQNNNTPSPANSSLPTPSAEDTPKTKIPDDVTYSIIKDKNKRDIKRTVEIRLNKQIDKDVLREIALSIKERENQAYQKTFIGYFIEGGDDKQGYWATTYFNPDLDIQIIGLSANDGKILIENSIPNNKKNKK